MPGLLAGLSLNCKLLQWGVHFLACMDVHDFDAFDQHEEQFWAASAILKKPRGQAEQTFDPLLAANVPLGHPTHAEAPAPIYWPKTKVNKTSFWNYAWEWHYVKALDVKSASTPLPPFPHPFTHPYHPLFISLYAPWTCSSFVSIFLCFHIMTSCPQPQNTLYPESTDPPTHCPLSSYIHSYWSLSSDCLLYWRRNQQGMVSRMCLADS